MATTITEMDEIKTVVFRVDASVIIGTGHIMRCLAFAKQLRCQSISSTFICRELEGNLITYIKDQGFDVFTLPLADVALQQDSDESAVKHADWLEVSWQQDSDECKTIIADIIDKSGRLKLDWIVVDHYALDFHWHKNLRHLSQNILVIDDLADRYHNCDVLLDQNLYDDMFSRYAQLVPLTCNKLLGPKYTLLRDEFLLAENYNRSKDGSIKKILLFFGGVDSSNETGKALQAIKQLHNTDITVDVVVGAANLFRDEIEATCHSLDNTQFHCQVDNIASLMSNADLMIAAGGTNSWERCYLGIPSITISTAFNQVAQNQALHKQGASILMGDNKNVTTETIYLQLKSLIADPQRVLQMSTAARVLMQDHVGITGVIDAMKNSQLLSTLTFRDMNSSDEQRLLDWRNAPHVKQFMFHQAIIEPEEHARWFKQTLLRDDVDYKIIEINGKPVGQANITDIKNSSCHWGFYLGELHVPKGTGTKFAFDLINTIFETYNIDSIIGEILSTNEKSIALHKRLGFTLDDALTKQIQIENDSKTVITMQLSRQQWLSNNNL